jgi:hypothetical protein
MSVRCWSAVPPQAPYIPGRRCGLSASCDRQTQMLASPLALLMRQPPHDHLLQRCQRGVGLQCYRKRYASLVADFVECQAAAHRPNVTAMLAPFHSPLQHHLPQQCQRCVGLQCRRKRLASLGADIVCPQPMIDRSDHYWFRFSTVPYAPTSSLTAVISAECCSAVPLQAPYSPHRRCHFGLGCGRKDVSVGLTSRTSLFASVLT